MKLQDLHEAKLPDGWLQTLAIFKKSNAFKDLEEVFDYTSSKIQEKNGNLYFTTKPEVMKLGKSYRLSANGEVQTLNPGASIWQKITNLKPVGIVDEGKRFEVLKTRAQDILDHFQIWSIRKNKSQNDVSNRRLKSLTVLMLPEKSSKDAFDCSNNELTNLLGGPIEGVRFFHAHSNELVSPLVGAPDDLEIFAVWNNKLTSFEGFPRFIKGMAANKNPITTLKGIHNHIKSCNNMAVDIVESGYMDLFRIKDLQTIYIHENGQRLDNELDVIINKHLKSPERDWMDCQEELIQAGLKRYAR